jgi:hypothetical protein
MLDTWLDEDEYWRTNYRNRPYARGMEYDTFSGGYRYGYDAAGQYAGRSWDDIEPELERGWDTYQYRGQSTWEQVKAAVRDAWDRITGRSTRTA